MTDRGILFSAPMVRALLAGTKTQTRRQLYTLQKLRKGGPRVFILNGEACDPPMPSLTNDGELWWDLSGVEKIAKGDRLWVREAWRTAQLYDDTPPRELRQGAFMHYEADGEEDKRTGVGLHGVYHYGRLRPGIHLPRLFSRLTLHVTDVRVQRLQAISEEDALAEGIPPVEPTRGHFNCAGRYVMPSPADDYKHLWDSINGAGSWAGNPWVVAITFTVERANIDAARP